MNNVVGLNDFKAKRDAKLNARPKTDNSLYLSSRDSSDDLNAFHVFKNLADDDWTVYTPSSVPFIIFNDEADARNFARNANRVVAEGRAFPYHNSGPGPSYA